jgi:hypothetical protein
MFSASDTEMPFCAGTIGVAGVLDPLSPSLPPKRVIAERDAE